ncbi:hypothetical protein H2O64_07100 [Kordia sp. YSTF-M3]|uniref:Lipoprotein n=1 Tax=Kordia aestuariivivens TaxID=2759037 RepID=A0ABR7Q7M4_9FLAO|nr:hypothetical protein [Kordia aestuariivivens]MBC8754433.1 hypothetical protein [Kordia aestuariivivens]
MKKLIFAFAIVLVSFTACKSDEDCCLPNPTVNNLIIKFKFDATQQRLNNIGQPATIPAGNAAQSPNFSRMSANYIEFAPSATTLLGNGQVIYTGAETNEGGNMAIDFQNAQFAGNDEVFLTIPLTDIAPGTYNWVRVSLAYQEGTIQVFGGGLDFVGTLASFVGYNTYITSLDFDGSTTGLFQINENKLQGFWAFEALGFTTQGQAPAGATTVPNPLFDSSPVPQGSCVVTGQFQNGFTYTGNETEDVVVTLSFSVNNSFEWTEINADGKYEPSIGEQLVDMGLRGLIPSVSN